MKGQESKLFTATHFWQLSSCVKFPIGAGSSLAFFPWSLLYLEPRDAFPVPEWTQKTFDHQQYRYWIARNKNCFNRGHRCSAFSIPGCSIQKFSLNYDHRVKYLIYLKGAVMTVLRTMFLMKCLKRFSLIFSILPLTRSRYPVTKWSHWRETSECHASRGGCLGSF